MCEAGRELSPGSSRPPRVAFALSGSLALYPSASQGSGSRPTEFCFSALQPPNIRETRAKENFVGLSAGRRGSRPPRPPVTAPEQHPRSRLRTPGAGRALARRSATPVYGASTLGFESTKTVAICAFRQKKKKKSTSTTPARPEPFGFPEGSRSGGGRRGRMRC